MTQDFLSVRGARQHNLKNISLDLPRNKLTVVTGLSGSGKSSLVFDTIYAEGQRRYVESLSPYARQFLGQLAKPDVDAIEGLSPAIAIDQRSGGHNPRSTVGTLTEIYEFLRLLFARIGNVHCPNCGTPIRALSPQHMADHVLQLPDGARVQILAPVALSSREVAVAALAEAQRSGFARVRIDGAVTVLSDANLSTIAPDRIPTIELIVDRLVIRHGGEDGDATRVRVTDSIETALRAGQGTLLLWHTDGREERLTQHLVCTNCGTAVPDLEPKSFSFNSPTGACPECTGLGMKLEFDPLRVLAQTDLSLDDGAIAPWARFSNTTAYYRSLLASVARALGRDNRTPLAKWTPSEIEQLLYGLDGAQVTVRYVDRQARTVEHPVKFDGVLAMLEKQYRETDNDRIRDDLSRYMAELPCPLCQGTRLTPVALSITIGGKNIADVSALSIDQAQEWIVDRAVWDALPTRSQLIATPILREVGQRLGFLRNVGLGYLSLDRRTMSLSGGESQRCRLASQIGTHLTGVLYVLDEPSVGLHQRDNVRLLSTLTQLRDLGNTVLVVEHDEDTMRAADWLVDIGPGAGQQGGEVVAEGTPATVAQHSTSLTARYLRGERAIPLPDHHRNTRGPSIAVVGARAHNLKNISVAIPLGCLVVVTGVSGSGKSTLVEDVLYRAAIRHFSGSRMPVGDHDRIDGFDHIDKVVAIDQAPIGRSARSNPATYVNALTPIRELFAQVPEARVRGYTASRFSFNVKGGRCEACHGEGTTLVEMQFLPDVLVPCDICQGARYNRETLEVRYRGLSIADVLALTVDAATTLFTHVPSIANRLRVAQAVGLGYVPLGQSASTLSGGEAQRLKLTAELSRRSTGKTLYLLDEPTTGLHLADVQRLLDVLNRLVDAGNTVLVIEHHLDVIKTADWVIDLGPDAGERGGQLVVAGSPEVVAACEQSITGNYLQRMLARSR